MSIQVSGVYGGGSKINGVKGEYLATANIAKGDFVQLTTKGVEEASFTKVGQIETFQWSQLVSAAVLSPTQFIVAFAVRDKNLGSSAATNLCVCLYTYINGTWREGVTLMLESFSSTIGGRVGICRLSETRTALNYSDSSSSGNSRLFVLDIHEEITVLASKQGWVGELAGNNSIEKNAMLPVSDKTFVLKYTASETVYLYFCTYKDDTIVQEKIRSLNETNFYMCKLNDTTALLFWVSGDYYYTLNFVDDSFSLVKTGLKGVARNGIAADSADNGPLVQIGENRAICATRNCGTSSTYNYSYTVITYDPETATLSKEKEIGTGHAKPQYFTMDAFRMGDSEIISLVAEETNPDEIDEPLYLMVVDYETDTYYQPRVTAISAVGEVQYPPAAYAGFGWLVVFSGATSILVAPLVSQITAAPYSIRIDGVASKGATAGQMAEVVTP